MKLNHLTSKRTFHLFMSYFVLVSDCTKPTLHPVFVLAHMKHKQL